jgi:hypothetical protein
LISKTCKLPLTGLLVLTLCQSAPVLAQAPELLSRFPSMEGIRVFETDYFIEFDPVTALDLVQRMPGFNPQQQNGGRGLAGVRTNILINGKRPPPKGQSIWEQLSSRPYTSVTRLEMINQGARMDIDMQGYNQVVNVILEDERTNYYELRTDYRDTGDGDYRQRNEDELQLNGQASIGWQGHEFNLRAGNRDRDRREPSGFVDIDPANPTQRTSTQTQSGQQEEFIELSTLFDLGNQGSLTLNSSFRNDTNDSAPISLDQNGAATGAISETYQDDRERQELSGEYIRQLSDRNELMVAFVDSSDIRTQQSSFVSANELLTSIREQDAGETAARIRLTRKNTERLTTRAILSSAFNYFEGSLQVIENGQPLSLDGSNSLVEEDRHSLALEADWTFRDNWLLRGSISGGAYALEARDVPTNKQTEVKGLASLSWQPFERTNITLESRYDIGQLSLNQFLASSNLSSDIQQAGAVRLDSERNWENRLQYDQRFGDRGVLKMTLGHRILENPIRSVALSDSLVVSQNAFAEKLTFFNTNLQYPFERFDMEDLVLEANLNLRTSDTIDPVTRESRPVSWVEPVDWSLGLRKNPGEGKWSWGVDIWKSVNNIDYGVRNTRQQFNSHEWRTFVQWEPINGLRLTARLDSQRNEFRVSEFFSAVRQPGLDPSFVSTTQSRRDSAPSFTLQWRRRNNLEITATINPRPLFQSREQLTEFATTARSLQTRQIAAGPSGEIRFRIYNR